MPAKVIDIKGSKHETELMSEARERLTEDANPREVAALARAMDPMLLRCRRMRQHKWEPTAASKVRGGFEEHLVCERCDATKARWYNSKGHIVEYGPVQYPDGYLFTGLGRLGAEGRDVINLASLQADLQVRVSAKKARRRTA